MHLIEERGLKEHREDFLRSRPRFNDTYFDGQRDPVEGWMSAVNAWRYPAFYVGPNYVMPEFTFKPPHTLFIDAALQAQDDAELIKEHDRVNNEASGATRATRARWRWQRRAERAAAHARQRRRRRRCIHACTHAR